MLSPDNWNRIGMVLGGVIVAFVSAVGGYIVYLLKKLAHWQDRQKSDWPIELSVRHTIDINIQLDRARMQFGAMRVHLNRFHNTGRYLDGGQITTCTRTHERVRNGVGYQAEVFNALLTSSVPHEVELVVKQGPAWTAVEKLPDCKFRWLCESGGTNAVARCGVYIAGELIGFVGADFDAPLVQAPACINDLCGYAREIGKILANYQK